MRFLQKGGLCMNEIIPKFNDSLIIDSSNLISDYLELGIDSILENDFLKSIPVVKSIIGLGKISRDIRNRNLIKNLAIFLNEFNSGNVNEKKLSNYRELLNKDNNKAEKELGRIIIILDQTIDNVKSAILAKLYKAYINQLIDWEMFIEFSEVTNRIYVNDLNTLLLIYKNELNSTKSREDLFRVERLNSLGIIGLSDQSINSGRHDYYIALNKIGKEYANIIFS